MKITFRITFLRFPSRSSFGGNSNNYTVRTVRTVQPLFLFDQFRGSISDTGYARIQRCRTAPAGPGRGTVQRVATTQRLLPATVTVAVATFDNVDSEEFFGIRNP